MRAFRLAFVITAVLAVGAAVAAAQNGPPTVTITASSTAVSATPVPVAPGATRFEFVSDGVAGGVFLGAPKPGRTFDEAVAAVRANPDDSLEVVDIVASASLTPGGRRAVTVDIEPGRTYLLVSDGGKENPADWAFSPLPTGGAPTGATAPRPDATIVMRDLRFGGASRLPRDGTIRVQNVGWAPHFAIAAPLRAAARERAVSRALLRNQDRALGRLLQFDRSFEVTNILTRGASADQEVTFRKRGRYVLLCFFEGHAAQGMFRFVSVR